MVRQTKQQKAAPELLNFHFSTPARSEMGYSHPRRSHQHNYNENGNRRRKKEQYKRSAQDMASARRRATSAMFILHSSANHSFFLTRRSTSKLLKNDSYSFSGCDEPVSWDSVKMVRELVTYKTDRPLEPPSCPICLCEYVCAVVTKCGHTFCLACVLRHMHSHAESHPYDHVKCACCALPLIVEDLRPIVVDCRPIPTVQQRIKMAKLHRQKNCPAPYLPIPNAPKHSNPHTAPCKSLCKTFCLHSTAIV